MALPKHIILDHGRSHDPQLRAAADAIESGDLVVFPTDTVYGVGCDALNVTAVDRLIRAKLRPPDLPFPVLLHDLDQVDELAREVSAEARLLMRHFWPGGVTLVLPRRLSVPDLTVAGRDSIGLRMPNDPVALALLRLCRTPVTGPSANRTGEAPARDCTELPYALLSHLAVIIDDGIREGEPSTVVDMTHVPARILRPGSVSASALADVIGVLPAGA